MAQTPIMSGKVLDGQSLAASFTSDSVDISNASLIGVQAVSASATHVGNLYIEVSNSGASGEWITVATVALANGTALLHFQTLVDVAARYLQLRYEATSGTGALTAIICKKGRL